MTLVQVKNSMQYWINPNGILWIGMRGPDLSGLSIARHWQNFRIRLTLLLVCSLCMAEIDSSTKPSTDDEIPIFWASQKYSCSTMVKAFTVSLPRNLISRSARLKLVPSSDRPSMIRSVSCFWLKQFNFPARDGDRSRSSLLGLVPDGIGGEPSIILSTVIPSAASASSSVLNFFFKSINTWRRILDSGKE